MEQGAVHRALLGLFESDDQLTDDANKENVISLGTDLALNHATARIGLLENALNNMVQGVLMFDHQDNMIFCNDIYIKMYDLSPELIKAGCSFAELMGHHLGKPPTSNEVLQSCQKIVKKLSADKPTSFYLNIADGRTIQVIVQPLLAGGSLITHEDVSRQKTADAQIAYMAHHDALTDLANRVLLYKQLEEALRWINPTSFLAVLFIDLDNFKSINDTFGHPAGDKLLKLVADRLRQCVGKTDIVARFGGDEFVIVKTKIEQTSDVATLASHIRDVISSPCTISDSLVTIDTSIGIAIAPNDGVDANRLLKNADMALYGAKGSGRGTYRFFEPEMDARMLARLTLELDLRKAIVNGEFELHYQPLVNLERNEISGCEALLRWNHPERGMIGPDAFIPVAEESGLIIKIGEWVIKTACMQAALWDDHINIAINVSPTQFQKHNLLSVIVNALAASGLPARRLEIEITEMVLIHDTKQALDVLNKLHALGVRITMDDFGTGYSSLSYLQKFPFDKIKIDRSFIETLADQPQSTAIIRAVTGMAKSFKMTTTAEGVETEEQRTIVAALGCTEMQGYLFSKARTASEISDLLGTQKLSGPFAV